MVASAAAYIEVANDRNWEAMASLLPADFAFVDHCPLGGVPRRDRAAMVGWSRELAQLSPDSRLRTVDVLAFTPRALLAVEHIAGTRDRAYFEKQVLIALGIAADGIYGVEELELGQVDEAWEVFERFDRPPVVTMLDRVSKLFGAGQPDSAFDLYEADVRFDDRRRLGGLVATTRDEVKHFFEISPITGVSSDVIEIVDDHLALFATELEVDDARMPIASIVELSVTSGRVAAVVLFDGDDMEAARAELARRAASGQPVARPNADLSGSGPPSNVAVRLTRAWAERFVAGDLDRAAEHYADDSVLQDHRPIVGGRVVGTPQLRSYLAAMRDNGVVDLTIEALDTVGEHGALVAALFRTSEGSVAENVWVVVVDPEHGRITHTSVWETADIETARAALSACRS